MALGGDKGLKDAQARSSLWGGGGVRQAGHESEGGVSGLGEWDDEMKKKKDGRCVVM